MFKQELELIIKSDNVWANRSTLVLAAGILGEYVVLPFLAEKEVHWKKFARIFCAVLVIGGILGEYGFSRRIAGLVEELQGISDQELGDADYRAAFLTTENARLQGNLRNLAQQIAPRRLSHEQESDFATRLKQFKGVQVQLDRELVSPEVRDLSDDLLRVLGPQGAEWIVVDFSSPEAKSAARGITIQMLQYATPNGVAAARALVAALRRAGVVVNGPDFSALTRTRGLLSDAAVAQMKIIVGRKP